MKRKRSRARPLLRSRPRRLLWGEQWRGRLRQRTPAELESMIADAVIRFGVREGEDLYTGDAKAKVHPALPLIHMLRATAGEDLCLCCSCLVFLVGNLVEALPDPPPPPSPLEVVRADVELLERRRAMLEARGYDVDGALAQLRAREAQLLKNAAAAADVSVIPEANPP